MNCFTLARSRLFYVAASVLLVLPGCGSVDPLALRDRDIDELRFENERRRESLLENLDENASQRLAAASLGEEKKSLFGQISTLSTNLKTVSDQLAAASTQRDEARAKVVDLEQTNERLRESVEKVKSVASASAGELAELRLKRRELEETNARLTQSEATLRDENGKLHRELGEARSELVRERAVSRSLQGNGATPAGTTSGAEGGDRHLEREIAGLRGENLALQRRIDSLTSAVSVSSANAGSGAAPPGHAAGVPVPADVRTAVSPPTPGTVYRDDPVGLLTEIGGFTRKRYEKAMAGNIAWDSFDLAVVGAAALLVLLVVWGLVRRARMRRLLAEARRGSARAREAARSPHAAGVPAASASELAADQSRSRRGASVRRPAFSAVISAKPVSPARDSAVEEESVLEEDAENEESSLESVEQVLPALPARSARSARSAGSPPAGPAAADVEEDPFHRLLAESAAKPSSGKSRAVSERDRAGSETRKVIGARSWQTEAPAAEELQDELANTQIIPSLSEEEIGPIPAAIIPVKPEMKKTALRETAQREVPARQAPAKPASRPAPAAAAENSDDRELLAELKSVINRKFDELMK